MSTNIIMLMFCLQAKRALQRGATAVVLDITDNPVAADIVRYLTFHPLLFCIPCRCSWSSISISPQWRAANAEIKGPSLGNTERKGFPFKVWSRQYIAMHATLTARNFFLADFYPSGPFTWIFSSTSPEFFLCLLWLTPVTVLAHRTK